MSGSFKSPSTTSPPPRDRPFAGRLRILSGAGGVTEIALVAWVMVAAWGFRPEFPGPTWRLSLAVALVLAGSMLLRSRLGGGLFPHCLVSAVAVAFLVHHSAIVEQRFAIPWVPGWSVAPAVLLILPLGLGLAARPDPDASSRLWTPAIVVTALGLLVWAGFTAAVLSTRDLVETGEAARQIGSLAALSVVLAATLSLPAASKSHFRIGVLSLVVLLVGIGRGLL